MPLESNILGLTGTTADVNPFNAIKIVPETSLADNPSNIGLVRIVSENDDGGVGASGIPQLYSPETDLDHRLRSGLDLLLDNEVFNYTAQNTGKFTYANTTMTNSFVVGSVTTNSANITTTSTATSFGSYAYFPLLGTSTLACDIEAAFTAQPTTNTVIDFGMFQRGAANPYSPTDGAYFRLTAAGLQGVINYNGTETHTGVFKSVGSDSVFTYTNNKKYQFIIYTSCRSVEFWINDGVSVQLYGVLATPSGNGQPFASSSLPVSWRHAIVGGAAGSAISLAVSNYSVRSGGPSFDRKLSEFGNAAYGSYQGLSGGTMGSLANYKNSTNPTAAVATNTTAALGTGLGGQFWETATIAVNTDGIVCSYLNPAATVSTPGRRLCINGVSLSSYVQTAVVGGPFNTQYSLAFGHTALSLATSEAATTKAPRHIPLPFVQTVTGAQAVSTPVAQTVHSQKFISPIYVNPGEYVALVKKNVGTVGTAGVVAHVVTFDYSWE